MHLRKEHVLSCTEEQFWRLMFDPEFDRQHALVANKMRHHELRLCDVSGETWELRNHVTPSTPIPKFIMQWLGSEFSFETVVTHKKGSSSAVGLLLPSVMPERIHMSFRLQTAPEPGGRCRRVMEWEVKIIGIGPIVERFIIGELDGSLQVSARFIDEYLKSAGPPAEFSTAVEPPRKPQKLWQSAAEYNLTEHCNLKCAGCNHAAHQLPKKFAVLSDCQRDLMALAAVMHLDELKFVGGEPLLHPELPAFLRMARLVGIADQLTLVTNGVLLHKMPEEVYSLIDRLWVSLYPSVKLQVDVQTVESLCKKHDVVLWLKETPTFQLNLINRKIEDAAVVQELYSQCAYTHVYSCHTIYEGRYYKCSPAPFVAPRAKLVGMPYSEPATDSVALHGNPKLSEQLAAYLADEKPLGACAYCVSHVGRDVPSRQLNKAELQRELREDHQDLIQLFHPDKVPAALRRAR